MAQTRYSAYILIYNEENFLNFPFFLEPEASESSKDHGGINVNKTIQIHPDFFFGFLAFKNRQKIGCKQNITSKK